jgi:hypothetical protein
MKTTVRPKPFGQSISLTALFVIGFLLSQPGKALAQWTSSGGNTYLTNGSDKVGVGTASPIDKLQVVGAINVSGSTGGFQLFSRAGGATQQWYNPNGDLRLFSSQIGDVFTIQSGGNVGIGTITPAAKLHVAGDAVIDGNIAAKYQDVAEWVPASRVIPAGSVVVLDAERSNHVLPSSRPYDTRVAGVVSASPGVVLGEGGAGKVMVATTGRVRVKVDATNGPIRVGDLLVTSDKEGIAMRSQPLDLGGTPIHRPGTLIGKALEPLEKGVGEILVLLSLQ